MYILLLLYNLLIIFIFYVYILNFSLSTYISFPSNLHSFNFILNIISFLTYFFQGKKYSVLYTVYIIFNLSLKVALELSFNLKIPSKTISSAEVVSSPVNPAKSFTQHPAAIKSLPLLMVPAVIGI